MVFHGYYFKTEKNGFTSHEAWQKRRKKKTGICFDNREYKEKGQKTRFVDLISLL